MPRGKIRSQINSRHPGLVIGYLTTNWPCRQPKGALTTRQLLPILTSPPFKHLLKCLLLGIALPPGEGEHGGGGSTFILQNWTTTTVNKEPFDGANRKRAQGLIVVIMIMVAVVVFTIIIAALVFVFYRKRLKEKFPQDANAQKESLRLQEIDDIITVTSTPIPSEPNTPNQTDGTVRTFTYPFQRRRLSSSGSVNSTTPMLKYRNGSYRSRFSSGVSSRIDSNIAEGNPLVIFRRHTSKKQRKQTYFRLTLLSDREATTGTDTSAFAGPVVSKFVR